MLPLHANRSRFALGIFTVALLIRILAIGGERGHSAFLTLARW